MAQRRINLQPNLALSRGEVPTFWLEVLRTEDSALPATRWGHAVALCHEHNLVSSSSPPVLLLYGGISSEKSICAFI